MGRSVGGLDRRLLPRCLDDRHGLRGDSGPRILAIANVERHHPGVAPAAFLPASRAASIESEEPSPAWRTTRGNDSSSPARARRARSRGRGGPLQWPLEPKTMPAAREVPWEATVIRPASIFDAAASRRATSLPRTRIGSSAGRSSWMRSRAAVAAGVGLPQPPLHGSRHAPPAADSTRQPHKRARLRRPAHDSGELICGIRRSLRRNRVRPPGLSRVRPPGLSLPLTMTGDRPTRAVLMPSNGSPQTFAMLAMRASLGLSLSSNCERLAEPPTHRPPPRGMKIPPKVAVRTRPYGRSTGTGAFSENAAGQAFCATGLASSGVRLTASSIGVQGAAGGPSRNPRTRRSRPCRPPWARTSARLRRSAGLGRSGVAPAGWGIRPRRPFHR